MLFGDKSGREIKKIMPLVRKTEALRETMQKLGDEELKGKTAEFKERLAKGASLDDILPEAFAAVREAARRTLGMEHFQVQIIGGIVLHQGRVAEMKTGEGKTLVCTLPAYLHALEGKGVCVVTVNDYLAKRDAEQMGQVHRFLGLTTGCITQEMKAPERKAAYACDITYITNNELGFDYLRDNMATSRDEQVQRGLHYAIIDEVDSILIDEARTPLIISSSSGKATGIYNACDVFVRTLKRGEASGEVTKAAAMNGEKIEETGDYIVYEKEKNVVMTASGIAKAERFFQVKNISDPEHVILMHHIDAALRANCLMHKDQDYVVRDGEVLIVDSFTGRIMPGRRFSDGIHQAIEAKEGVKVNEENRTMATITFQNFFNKFDLKCGMTGTAKTEEAEFKAIYGMDVVTIPTNRPVIRVDHEDAVFHTKDEKDRAIVRAVIEAHQKHQPVLVGTVNVDTSEYLSGLLDKESIPHTVLNAKYHAQEAEIVSHAGEADAVTIATNMAGRGTDIKLDETARAAGGLYVIGTERHESRRIDNQLRGRSGRQGDPGESRFYISLEDELLRLFAPERLKKLFEISGIKDEPIEHRSLSRAIEKAQEKVETNNFGIRKDLLDYDRVNNEQREVIYEEREKVLAGEDVSGVIRGMIEAVSGRIADEALRHEGGDPLSYINARMSALFGTRPLSEKEFKACSRKKLPGKLARIAEEGYRDMEKRFENADTVRTAEREVLLHTIDRYWISHLDTMEQLRQYIRTAAYGQKDPRIEYRVRGTALFNEIIGRIEEDTLKVLFRIVPPEKEEPKPLEVKLVGVPAEEEQPA